jgi:CBS domain containing-hemolysin-like protein
MKNPREILNTQLKKLGRSKKPSFADKLDRVLEEGKLSGSLNLTEHELIRSILKFTDTTAKEIMVPRPDIIALDISTSTNLLIQKAIDEQYSRLPVFKDDLDNIVGIVYTKDLLGILEHRDLIILHDILRPAYFVPESKKISNLLREFQARKVHLAIVVDEFGGTVGIITMEDIIEEIVGEIHDEHDEVLKSAEPAKDGSMIVEGTMSIFEFNKQFNASIPETPDYETIAGYIQKITERFPDVNEEIMKNGFNFTIVSKSARRIRQIRIKPLPVPTSNDHAE